MKILIVSQYFHPENFRINDLASSLLNKGHEVSVVTGNPNYPKGDFFEGYGFRFINEYYKGIEIFRVPIISRGNNKFRLILNYLSFVFFGSVFLYFHRNKYDKVFAVNYSPITAIVPAIVYCKKNKIKLGIWVQDLWPESLSGGGNIRSKYILRIMDIIVKYIYKKSDIIFISNSGFKNSIIDKGDFVKKIKYMPNWAEDIYDSKNYKINSPKMKFNIPKGFIIMFAGNFGEAQDLKSVIKAADLTKNNSNIQWVFVGSGRKLNWLENKINESNLSNVITLLGRHPIEQMPFLFSIADAMLVTLRDEYIFSLTVPGKVQSYMASKKPILSMLNGAGNDVILDANCGLTANSGDYVKLSDNISNIMRFSDSERKKMGENGYNYYKKYFSKDKIIDKFIEDLNGC